MDDHKTAREIADLFYTDGSHERLTNAIVAALERARREGIDANDVDLVAPEPTRRTVVHCYPFSTETCQRPECKCREEKAAMEGGTCEG